VDDFLLVLLYKANKNHEAMFEEIMVEVSLPIAFTAGLLSFFAPCVVPLLPTYVAYIFGVSTRDHAKVLSASIFYLLGFSLIFVVLGTFAGSIGSLFRSFDQPLLRIGGVILILFGLETLGVFHIALPQLGRIPTLPTVVQNITAVRSFFLGVVFSLAWTPCVGAILGSILVLASATKTAVSGATLLFVYSLGISIPFLLISFLIRRGKSKLTSLQSFVPVAKKVSGFLLVAIGVLLLTDTFKYLNAWIFDIAFRLGYQIR